MTRLDPTLTTSTVFEAARADSIRLGEGMGGGLPRESGSTDPRGRVECLFNPPRQKRPSQCATGRCWTPRSAHFFCALMKTWLPRPERAAADVAGLRIGVGNHQSDIMADDRDTADDL